MLLLHQKAVRLLTLKVNENLPNKIYARGSKVNEKKPNKTRTRESKVNEKRPNKMRVREAESLAWPLMSEVLNKKNNDE